MKKKEEIIAFGYRIFILLIIATQLYSIIFQEVNTFTLITNGVLIIYLAFRFYLLIKLSKDADELNVPFVEFLNIRCIRYEKCKCKGLESDDIEIFKD